MPKTINNAPAQQVGSLYDSQPAAPTVNAPNVGASSDVAGKYAETHDVYEGLDRLGVKARSGGTTMFSAAKAEPGELMIGTSAKGELAAYVGPGSWRKPFALRDYAEDRKLKWDSANVHQVDKTGHFAITNPRPGTAAYFGVDGELKTAEGVRAWTMDPTAYYGTLDLKHLPHEARVKFHSGSDTTGAGDIGGRYGYIGEGVPELTDVRYRRGDGRYETRQELLLPNVPGQTDGVAGVVCAPNAGYGVLANNVAKGRHEVVRGTLIAFTTDDLIPVVDAAHVTKGKDARGRYLPPVVDQVQPCFCPLPETKLLESMPVEWWTKDNCEAKLETEIEYYFDDYPKWQELNNTKKRLRNLLFEFAVAFSHERLQHEKADFFWGIHDQNNAEAKKFREDLLAHLQKKAKDYGVRLKDFKITDAFYEEVKHATYGFDPETREHRLAYDKHGCPTTKELNELRADIQSLVNQLAQAPRFHTKQIEEKIAQVKASREKTASKEAAERSKVYAEANKTVALREGKLKAVEADASSNRQTLLKEVAGELRAVPGQIREKREKALAEALAQVKTKIAKLEKETETAAERRLKNVDEAKITRFETEKKVVEIETEAVRDTADMAVYAELPANALAAKTRDEVADLLQRRAKKLGEIQEALRAAVKGKGTFGLDPEKRFRAYLVGQGRDPYGTMLVSGVNTVSTPEQAAASNLDPEIAVTDR